jgi:hypothetical protein
VQQSDPSCLGMTKQEVLCFRTVLQFAAAVIHALEGSGIESRSGKKRLSPTLASLFNSQNSKDFHCHAELREAPD